MNLTGVTGNRSSSSTMMLQQFQLMKVLGAGAFGKTYLAKDTRTNKPVAIKTILKQNVKSNATIYYVVRENRALRELHHPFIVKGLGSIQTEDFFCFVTEYLGGGELFFYTSNGPFPQADVVFYCAEILSAIKYLHSKNVIYRDLKVENIMLDMNGHIRLIDFGLCRDKYDPEFMLYEVVGTPSFHAPEVIKKEGYSFEVDWWGLGIVTYELMTGRPPFDSDIKAFVHEHILKAEVKFPKTMTLMAKSLIRGLLNKDKRLRLGVGGAHEIMSHRFFKGINWDDIEKLKMKPPFIPALRDMFDTSYFKEEFTRQEVSLKVNAVYQNFYGQVPEWQVEEKSDNMIIYV